MDELTEYGSAAYAKCLDDMVKLMIEKGVNAAVLILAEVRAAFGASTFSTQIVRVEVLDITPTAGED